MSDIYLVVDTTQIKTNSDPIILASTDEDKANLICSRFEDETIVVIPVTTHFNRNPSGQEPEIKL